MNGSNTGHFPALQNSSGNKNFKKMTTTLDRTSDVVGAESAEERLSLGGHRIIYSDGFMRFECQHCEETIEVPEIFQASSSFNAVIYQLYILANFRKSRCPGKSPEDKSEAFGTIVDKTNPTRTTPDKNAMYWSNNSSYKIDVGNGQVTTDGSVVYESSSPDYTAGDTLSKKEITKLHRKI